MQAVLFVELLNCNLALLTGIGNMAGLDLPTLAILLILLSALLILKPWFEERGIFGKAEQ
jgi:hypothetical protein